MKKINNKLSNFFINNKKYIIGVSSTALLVSPLIAMITMFSIRNSITPMNNINLNINVEIYSVDDEDMPALIAKEKEQTKYINISDYLENSNIWEVESTYGGNVLSSIGLKSNPNINIKSTNSHWLQLTSPNSKSQCNDPIIKVKADIDSRLCSNGFGPFGAISEFKIKKDNIQMEIYQTNM